MRLTEAVTQAQAGWRAVFMILRLLGLSAKLTKKVGVGVAQIVGKDTFFVEKGAYRLKTSRLFWGA